MESMRGDDQMQWLMKRFSQKSVDDMSNEMKTKMTPDMLKFMNACGILYFLTVTFLIVLISFCLTLPSIHSGTALWIRAVIGILIVGQIAVNFFLICTRKSFCAGSDSKTSTTTSTTFDALPSSDWRMCSDCGFRSPPRSHHCPLCRRCIAERDHHCFFTASCIGRDNRRHFVAFCFDCAVGSGYALYVAVEYLSMFHPDDGYVRLVLPLSLIRWIIGWQSVGSLAVIFFIYICAMTSFGSACIGLWQAFLIVRGQTSYDFQSISSTGRLGGYVTMRSVGRNVRSVCGPYWFVVFVVPWPLFKLPDGLDSTKIL